MNNAFIHPNKTAIMAILNITPDSFSDGGQLFGDDFNRDTDNTLLTAQLALECGAEILDIGGESTRPGAQEVSTDDELCRVIPVIKALQQVYPQAILSIDTRKAEVAREAVKAGARIINDVSGLQYDVNMADVAAETGARLVIMHSQGTPDVMQNNPSYPRGVMTEIKAFFEQQVDTAMAAGVKKENIILDPGFGFGKTVDHNFEILARLSEFKALGFPILAGLSRKGFLTQGQPDSIPPHQRDSLTAAALTTAIAHGADIVRIHNVPTLSPVIRFADRLYRSASVRHPGEGRDPAVPANFR